MTEISATSATSATQVRKSTRVKLSDQYRPERFEEVVGQARTVQILSALIRDGRRAEDLLLYGSVGSGKTSLARIYGRALNCLAVDPATGSPCDVCTECTRGTRDNEQQLFIEYDTPRRSTAAKVRAFLEQCLHIRVPDGRCLVIFFDEAHSLEPEASDILLKVVEDHPTNVVFCFATTEPELLRAALRSRLMQLEVKALTVADAEELISRVARAAGIRIEPSAVSLLAAAADRFPRDLLTVLDALWISAPEGVTVTTVKERLALDYLDAVPDYFLTLAHGEPNQAAELLFDWPDATVDKITWVQAFLTSLYFTDILGVATVTDPRMAAIPGLKRQAVVDAMLTHFGVGAAEKLAAAWVEMMSVWRVQRAATDEQLLLSLALFHSGFSVSPALPSTPPAPAPAVSAVSSVSASGRMLGQDDIGRILNAASALVQRTGRKLDTAMEYSLPADSDETLADRLGGDICAYSRGRDWAHQHASFVRVTERYGDRLTTRMVLSLFDDANAETELVNARLAILRTAVDGWFASRGQDAVRVDLRLSGPLGRSMRFHWDETIQLCTSMAETWEVIDGAGRRQPFHAQLGISVGKLRHPNALSYGSVLGMTGSLGPMDDDEAELGLTVLSAVDDGRWELLRSGWELDEYVDRLELRRRRRDELLRSRENSSADETAALLDSWHQDPKRRPRNWLGWWV